jgi:hypothetical protein
MTRKKTMPVLDPIINWSYNLNGINLTCPDSFAGKTEICLNIKKKNSWYITKLAWFLLSSMASLPSHSM